MKPLIWLVEDEPGIADTLIYLFESEGFKLKWFDQGKPVLTALQYEQPALVILDVGLPDINGFDLCRRLLTQVTTLPILFLTARSDELDRIIGLEIGADDYVAKPFSPRELSSRVRVILRRLQRAQSVSVRSGRLVLGAFVLDEEGARVTYYQKLLLLTRYEYMLLKTLLMSSGRILSRQQLMNTVWTQAEDSLERTVDTHIKTLRAKLHKINEKKSPILTHRGLGYSLSICE